VHGAVCLGEEDMRVLDALGKVEIVVVPNGHHRLDAQLWKERYRPGCRVLCPRACKKAVKEEVPRFEMWKACVVCLMRDCRTCLCFSLCGFFMFLCGSVLYVFLYVCDVCFLYVFFVSLNVKSVCVLEAEYRMCLCFSLCVYLYFSVVLFLYVFCMCMICVFSMFSLYL